MGSPIGVLALPVVFEVGGQSFYSSQRILCLDT